MGRPQSKYVRVDPQNPEGAGECQRCSRWYQLRELVWQDAWGGVKLYNTQLLVCQECYDIPNENLRTIILEPDPPPLLNARVPNFAYSEQTARIIQFAGPFEPPQGAGPQMLRCTQSGEQVRILQYLTSS